MELLQLRYFYESAANESFAQTAKKYMVPTSSVSASVKRLEEELGCQLFDRSSNRIILNAEGKKFQRSLCLIFQELDERTREISSKAEDVREIKMLVRAMRRDITEHIINYSKINPKVSFKTVFDFRENNFEEYDIIIDENSSGYTEYDKFELLNIKIKMKVSKSSHLAGKSLTMKELASEPFLSLGEESNMHKMLISSCKNSGFVPDIAVMSNDIACHERLIEAGLGIGLGREELSDNTVFLNVLDFNERYSVWAYYKKGSCYGNVKDFLDYLRANKGKI